ncbi:hypothetical protein B0H03_103173 [Rathayibacter iranicus NCPPB 2253 = VKM Ac-1602]|nr:hypothetical protein B0H03_103173 [Rathayibacter iranicus NCPPB 2253 = VKM Ac-1602]
MLEPNRDSAALRRAINRKGLMTIIRLPRRILALVAGACCATALAVFAPALPAANAESLRDRIPIMAGTALELPDHQQCTAGPVLRSRSLISRLTYLGAATRYVILPKHCAPEGAIVRVAGQIVGRVTWTSPRYDIGIVTVPPSTVQRPVCSGPSQLHHCTVPTATPKAVGRVILSRGQLQGTVPLSQTGEPSSGERFCISGAVTFTSCGFGFSDAAPVALPSGALGARSYDGHLPEHGDSGGPVISVHGTLYGIIICRATRADTIILGYLPIAFVLREIGENYELAPA